MIEGTEFNTKGKVIGEEGLITKLTLTPTGMAVRLRVRVTEEVPVRRRVGWTVVEMASGMRIVTGMELPTKLSNGLNRLGARVEVSRLIEMVLLVVAGLPL